MLTNTKINVFLSFVILLSIISGCSQNEEENYVARVGDSYLTENEVEDATSINSKSKKFREEYIRNWIETELIYLDAIKKGVLNSEEYVELLNNAKVEIAKSLVIKAEIEQDTTEITEKQLEDFYVNNFREFKIVSPKVIYNKAIFNTKKEAVRFRKNILNYGWETVVAQCRKSNLKINIIENKSDFISNISNKKLKKYF